MPLTKLILILTGLGIAGGSGARYVLDQSWSASGWPAVDGRIISSSVVEKPRTINSGRRTTSVPGYEPRIVYRYSVGGAERTGSRIWSGQAETWDSRDGAEAFAADYPLMSTVEVRYNPDAPDEAYLVANRPSFGWILLGLFGLLLAWFGTKARGSNRNAPAP